MSIVCAISGTVPEEPVISAKSGHLFEKRLIVKHIDATGQCPVTGQPLAKEDLIPLQVNKAIKPRPVTATSLPALLQLFQNEWDAMMTETFQLKQHLDAVRQELAHSLYQHDAACRVIARLTRERDEARAALANIESRIATAAVAQPSVPSAASPMEVESTGPAGLSADIIARMQQLNDQLSRGRKKRAIPADLSTAADLKEFTEVASQQLSQTKDKSSPVLCVDLVPGSENLVAIGGEANDAVLYDHKTQSVVSLLSGHSSAVVDIACHPKGEDIIITASGDTARIFSGAIKGSASLTHSVKSHGAEVTSVAFHPLGDLAFTTGGSSWSLMDVMQGVELVHTESQNALSVCAVHPDGLILGTGSAINGENGDGIIQIWDVRSQAEIASFRGHKSSLSTLVFSENGYQLVSSSAGSESCVLVWDLRKAAAGHIHRIEPEKSSDVIHAARLDKSAKYLAVAGSDLRVYAVKEWQLIKTYSDIHNAPVKDLQWGPSAGFFVTASLDGSSRVFTKRA